MIGWWGGGVVLVFNFPRFSFSVRFKFFVPSWHIFQLWSFISSVWVEDLRTIKTHTNTHTNRTKKKQKKHTMSNFIIEWFHLNNPKPYFGKIKKALNKETGFKHTQRLIKDCHKSGGWLFFFMLWIYHLFDKKLKHKIKHNGLRLKIIQKLYVSFFFFLLNFNILIIQGVILLFPVLFC